MNGLIGYTGFVGSNLAAQRRYDAFFNSKNFQEMTGKKFDLLVCAGVSAVKWQANREPEVDRAKIAALEAVLETVRADRFILISTIDVYARLQNCDETFDNHLLENHAYGRHRLAFEDFCQKHFPACLIVRLPGLFGNGLKKNVIYDLLHDNCLDTINPASSFQYYFLDHLSNDIELAEKADLKLINLFTEPISTAEIIERFFPGKMVGSKPGPEGHYDLHTAYARLRNRKEPYFYSRPEVLAQMEEFIERERHV